MSSIEWLVLAGFIAVLGFAFPILRIVPYLMFGGTFLVALSYMIHAKIEPKLDTIRARLLVAFLALAQPLVRGWMRYYTWLKFKRTPQSVIALPEASLPDGSLSGSNTQLDFWNESGTGREKLLEEVFASLETEGWRYSADTGWKQWDAQIYGNQFWIVKLRTVTEYHGGPKCLTRVNLGLKPVFSTVLILAIFLGVILWRYFISMKHDDVVLWAAFAILCLSLAFRAYRLKRRVAHLVIAAASRSGLSRVFGAKSKPMPE